MLFISLLFAIFSFTLPILGDEQCKCGIENPPPIMTRIIYGQKITYRKYPWMVLIMEDKGPGQYLICTGSIINDRFIMTAAHCLQGNDISKYRVFLANSCDRKEVVKGPSLKLKRLHKHNKYHLITDYHDIGLFEVAEPFVFSDSFRPVCLWNQSTADNLFVAGWGKTNFGFLLRDTDCLREAVVQNRTKNDCVDDLIPYFDTRYAICAGGKSTACFGDSGGPLSTRKDGIIYQIGITSFTTMDCQIMKRGPAAYERILPHLEWMSDIIIPTGAKWCAAPYQV